MTRWIFDPKFFFMSLLYNWQTAACHCSSSSFLFFSLEKGAACHSSKTEMKDMLLFSFSIWVRFVNRVSPISLSCLITSCDHLSHWPSGYFWVEVSSFYYFERREESELSRSICLSDSLAITKRLKSTRVAYYISVNWMAYYVIHNGGHWSFRLEILIYRVKWGYLGQLPGFLVMCLVGPEICFLVMCLVGPEFCKWMIFLFTC